MSDYKSKMCPTCKWGQRGDCDHPAPERDAAKCESWQAIKEKKEPEIKIHKVTWANK